MDQLLLGMCAPFFRSSRRRMHSEVTHAFYYLSLELRVLDFMSFPSSRDLRDLDHATCCKLPTEQLPSHSDAQGYT